MNQKSKRKTLLLKENFSLKRMSPGKEQNFCVDNIHTLNAYIMHTKYSSDRILGERHLVTRVMCDALYLLAEGTFTFQLR